MQDYMHASHQDVFDAIRDSGKLESATEEKLVAALNKFADIFQSNSASAGGEAA
jgi:F0F1-type ATP synthase alpha subunit